MELSGLKGIINRVIHGQPNIGENEASKYESGSQKVINAINVFAERTRAVATVRNISGLILTGSAAAYSLVSKENHEVAIGAPIVVMSALSATQAYFTLKINEYERLLVPKK